MNGGQLPSTPRSCLGWLVFALLALVACAPTTEPSAKRAETGDARTTSAAELPAHFTDHEFVTADGQSLPLRKWLPRDRVRAVILALHGFNDYSNAFDKPGKAWAAAGIATYAYDQRGFGGASDRGRWPGRAALAADAAAASEILRRRYPGTPLYLLGESMGGAVVTVAMTGESGTPIPDVDGVVLVAPAVWGRPTMDFLPRVALWVGVRLAPGLTLTGRGLHILASDNIPMLRALARDPWVIKETRVDTIWGLVNLMDAALASAPRLRVRLLLMYGATDEIIPSGRCAALSAHCHVTRMIFAISPITSTAITCCCAISTARWLSAMSPAGFWHRAGRCPPERIEAPLPPSWAGPVKPRSATVEPMPSPHVLRLVLLLFVANATPVIAKKLLGDRFSRALDGNRAFFDGQSMFGRSKTIRGIIFAIMATTAAAPLIGLTWQIGLLVGSLAMAGDLFSSFVKRRLGRQPSSPAVGLDQIPESLFPLLACVAPLSLTVLDVAIGVAIFFFAELLVSRLLYAFNLRDRPY